MKTRSAAKMEWIVMETHRRFHFGAEARSCYVPGMKTLVSLLLLSLGGTLTAWGGEPGILLHRATASSSQDEPTVTLEQYLHDTGAYDLENARIEAFTIADDQCGDAHFLSFTVRAFWSNVQ